MNRVVPARMGAATGGAPSGKSESLPSTTVIIVEASNMRTVPATNGLMTRRSQESREMNTNCINDEATIRLDSNAGPPANSAEIQMAMKADAELMLREYPDPNLQNRKVLQDTAYTADHEGRKEYPGQITLRLSACHSDDRRRGSHCRHAGHDTLESMDQRYRMAWPLIRLIEDVFVYLRHS